MSNTIESKPYHPEIVTTGEKPAQKLDDVSVALGQNVQDEESQSSFKEAEVLDVFGNEEGAEIHCTLFCEPNAQPMVLQEFGADLSKTNPCTGSKELWSWSQKTSL